MKDDYLTALNEMLEGMDEFDEEAPAMEAGGEQTDGGPAGTLPGAGRYGGTNHYRAWTFAAECWASAPGHAAQVSPRLLMLVAA